MKFSRCKKIIASVKEAQTRVESTTQNPLAFETPACMLQSYWLMKIPYKQKVMWNDESILESQWKIEKQQKDNAERLKVSGGPGCMKERRESLKVKSNISKCLLRKWNKKIYIKLKFKLTLYNIMLKVMPITHFELCTLSIKLIPSWYEAYWDLWEITFVRGNNRRDISAMQCMDF